MGRFLNRKGSDALPDDHQGGDRRQGERAGSGDRRSGSDRRGSIDLNWPRYNERRLPGGSRRRDEQRAVASQRGWLPSTEPKILFPPTDAAALSKPPATRTVEELEADFAGMHEAMDRRLELMKDLSPEEFEAIQARDEELVTAWAIVLRRLEIEIAERRQEIDGANA